MNIDNIQYQVIALVLLLLLLLASFAFMKKSNFSKNSRIKVISMLSLGVKEKIALIEIDQKKFIVGITNHMISKIHHFDDEIDVDESEPFRL